MMDAARLLVAMVLFGLGLIFAGASISLADKHGLTGTFVGAIVTSSLFYLAVEFGTQAFR